MTDEILDPLKTAGADIVDSVKDAAAEAVGKVTGGVLDALKGSEPVPAVEGAPNVQESLQNGLSFLGDALKGQIIGAVTEMSKASADLTKASLDVVLHMEDLGKKVLSGEIAAETADLAMDNYLHALDLYKSALVNEAQAQAYGRAKTALETSKAVLFSLLRFAIQAAAPAAAGLIDRLGEAATELRK